MTPSNSLNRCAYPWQQMIIDLTGEVVPCCFWAGYGNTGKPLGNTNQNSIEEIWHGEGYRQLRETVAAGTLDGHPCGNCLAYRWSNGLFPRFTWPAGFVQEDGHCYLGQIPENFLHASNETAETIRLFEDETELPHRDAQHDLIRRHGLGRYSVWRGWIYFSSSDNQDPLQSGRSYVLVSGNRSVRLGSLARNSESGRNLLRAFYDYSAGLDEVRCEPSMISLISTADCNIDCPSCSQNIVRLTKIQHRPNTVPDVLSKISYLGQFIWHGGEPYLIKRFREFVDGFETSDNPNLTFGFTSNGTMIGPEEADKLMKFPRINASISMDSFKAETFGKIRSGASFSRVLENVQHLISRHNAPERIFTVGMVVCKSNFLEVADNIKFAIEHDIGLNLSPIVLYPVVEQINCFSDFDNESRGWREAIERAIELVDEAKSQDRLAIRRVDPTGMLLELKRILDEEQSNHAGELRIDCYIDDQMQGLVNMRRPALVVYSEDKACSYVLLKPGISHYTLRAPKAVSLKNDTMRVDFLHDVMEPNGVVATLVPPTDIFELRLKVPHLKMSDRPRNIKWANYGSSTPDGHHVRKPEEIDRIYKQTYKDEFWSAKTEFGFRVRTQNPHDPLALPARADKPLKKIGKMAKRGVRSMLNAMHFGGRFTTW